MTPHSFPTLLPIFPTYISFVTLHSVETKALPMLMPASRS